MADIFLSYSSADRARVAPLAHLLQRSGYSVWWDRDIRVGADFAETIEREIASAKAVIVAWSEEAAHSAWVRDEASYAQRKGILVPLLLSANEPPMGFRQVQALDFRDWRGDEGAPVYNALLKALSELTEHPFEPREAARASPAAGIRALRSFAGRRRSAVFAVAALAIVGIALLVWKGAWSPSSAGTLAAGEVEIGRFPASPATAERDALATRFADSFRRRLSEVGVANTLPPTGDARPTSELVLSGDLARDGDKDVLTIRIADRKSGAMLWSISGEPSQGAEREANLAAFALRCALKRRDPARGAPMFSRYLYGCGHYLEGDMQAMQAAGLDLYRAAPDDPRAIAFYAVGDIGVGYGNALSKADHDRFIGHARQLAAEALKLDPKNADALFAMGFTLDERQYAEQEKWWRAAVDADVDGWGPGRYANFLATVGRITEAVDMELRALQARRGLATRTAGLIASTGNLDLAHQIYDLARPLDPDEIAGAEVETAVRYDTIDNAERLLKGRSNVGDQRCLEIVLEARRGKSVDRVELHDACGTSGESSARYLAMAGDVDGAYTAIERMLNASHSSGMVPRLFWPEMRSFVRDRRFWPLAARLKLVDYWLDTDQWPDFCGEPDLPFDCRTQALAVRERSQ